MLKVARIRVSELGRLSGVATPNINRAVKNSEKVYRVNNRVLGIDPEAVEDFLLKRGHEEIYRPGLYVVTSQVGGTAKTSATIALAMAYRRLSDRRRPVVLIDTDSQGSLTAQLTGDLTFETPVLSDYLDGKAKLNEILTDLGQGLFLIKSNLRNIYLDRKTSDPKTMKVAGKILIDDIFKTLGNQTKIFVDTPPQLSSFVQSLFVCMAGLSKSVDRKVLIPVRCDKVSIQGAAIAVTEARSALETFNLDLGSLDIHVFLTGYDQRVKVSVDAMRRILEEPLLKDLLAPLVIKHSSEFTKKSFINQHIFSADDYKTTVATADYSDMLLYVLGYTGGGN